MTGAAAEAPGGGERFAEARELARSMTRKAIKRNDHRLAGFGGRRGSADVAAGQADLAKIGLRVGRAGWRSTARRPPR